MKQRTLLYTGTLTALIFWISTIVGGLIHGNYNHLTDTVSALGAIGTKSQIFMAVSTMLCGISSCVFMVAMYHACKTIGVGTLPVFSIICIPAMFFWAAVFPSGNSLHPVLGPLILLLYIGIIASLFLWRDKALRKIRVISVISVVAMLLIFLRFIPVVQNSVPGLIQRFAHLGWSVWFIGLHISFSKLSNNAHSSKTNSINH